MSFKVLCIGVGMGGSRMCDILSKRLTTVSEKNEPFYINISSDELNIFNSTSEKNKIRIGNIDGAGKNREVALAAFGSDFDYSNFIETVKQRVIDDNIDIITISFSTSGGTGSGIAPVLVRMISEVVENRKLVDRDIYVMGIALLPSFNEGISAFRNTLLTINDINKGINKGNRYFLVKNDGKEGSNFTEKCEAVNASAAALITKYFKGTYQISTLGVLDMNDRMMGLAIPGLHALSKLEDCSVSGSPFVVPGSNVCKVMLCEIPEENSDMYENEVSETTSLDYKYGYTTGDTGIVAYHGFRNIEKETIKYRKRFDDLKELDVTGNVNTGTNSLESLKSEVYNYSIKKDNTGKDSSDVTEPKVKKTGLGDLLNEFSDIDNI